MKTALLLAAIVLPLGACTLTPEQEAWNRAHHVGEIPLTIQSGPLGRMPTDNSDSPFNGKDFADPNPHSDSDAAQRAAYEANQQRQRDEAARKSAPDPFSTDGLNCTTTGSYAGSANSGTSRSSTSCHN